jgi:hypothetical protein
MKGFFCVALATAFFALSAPADSSAQTSIFVGGGATVPTGDFSDFDGDGAGTDGASTGWQATAGAQFAIGGGGFTVGPRVFYGSNNHETADEKTNLYGASALANYGFGQPDALNPFLWGEFGVMSHAFKSTLIDDTSTAAMWSAGAGLGFPLGGVNGFIAAGYTAGLSDNSDTTLFGIYAGASFAVGGG